MRFWGSQKAAPQRVKKVCDFFARFNNATFFMKLALHEKSRYARQKSLITQAYSGFFDGYNPTRGGSCPLELPRCADISTQQHSFLTVSGAAFWLPLFYTLHALRPHMRLFYCPASLRFPNAFFAGIYDLIICILTEFIAKTRF